MTLLEEHVERFNEGVRTGDWSRMLELFTDDAELVFEGIPVGPFHGRETIEGVYRAQPPDDEIVLLEQNEGVGVYAWARRPRVRAGELRLVDNAGRIRRLTVVYERD
jgi:steroid delta-isomerase